MKCNKMEWGKHKYTIVKKNKKIKTKKELEDIIPLSHK